MADILTQLQTCLDQLATQFYATLCYITTYHDHSPATPPNVPDAHWQLDKIPKNAPPATASAASAATAAPAEAATSTGTARGDSNGGGGGGATPAAAATTTAGGGGGGGGGGASGGQGESQGPEAAPPGPPRPDSPNTFQSRQRELARDLIIKEQQIEYLISVLPGIESSEKQQEDRIKQLAEELRVVEAQRRQKRREMKNLREKVDGLLGAVSRGMGISS